jgi:O-antigen biosynthesis protein
MLAVAEPAPVDKVAPRVIGTIESLGQVSEREIFLTGWSHDELAPGSAVLILSGEGVVEGMIWAAWSDRADVGPRATFTGLIETEAPVERDSIKGIGLPDARVLTLYAEAARYELAQSAQLLRGVLPNAADRETRERLSKAAAQYEGTDTIAVAELPVRLGIDDCVAMPGGILLVKGWLFDPERLVTSVSVAGAEGERRIDERWIGQARPDVTASYANDPVLGGYVHAGDAHGFSAIVDGAGDDAHIAVTFADHAPLHVPLVPRTGNAMVLLRRVLHSLDPDAPGSLDIVEKQIAPALAAITLPEPTATAVSAHVEGPLSLIVGCHGDCGEVPALLTILAANPAMKKVPIVVAAGDREMTIHAGQIERAARMLGLRLVIVVGRNIEDRFDAAAIGVAASDTELVCVTTGSVVPQSQTWLSRLLAVRKPDSAVVPRMEAMAGKPAAAEECFLVSRELFLEAGGFGGAFLDPAGKPNMLLRRMAATGILRIDAETTMTVIADPAGDAWQMLAKRADTAAAAIRARAGSRA